ncbi:MAG: hypothetical protein M1832_001981 [Thelocarpon impressellum]|nr:MAG: hypothetical protein M1832_001981 [Thelocarpon impressellum]
MPAPLAKGLIIGISVLVAAGVAMYESPQVREWVEKSRRRIAVALHSLGDEVHPQGAADRNADDEEVLAQARRKTREGVAEKNMRREEVSFDDFLEKDGGGAYSLGGIQGELRRRIRTDQAGAADANGSVLFDRGEESRESTATLAAEEVKEEAEPLVDLTTLTSGESVFPPAAESTPLMSSVSSVSSVSLAGSDGNSSDGQAHEYAYASAAEHALAASQDGGEPAGVNERERDFDVLSATSFGDGDADAEAAGVKTPTSGTWTEVGSEVSEGDVGR